MTRLKQKIKSIVLWIFFFAYFFQDLSKASTGVQVFPTPFDLSALRSMGQVLEDWGFGSPGHGKYWAFLPAGTGSGCDLSLFAGILGLIQ